MIKMTQIFFSRGGNKYDNCPEQRSATDFNTFIDLVDKDRSPHKGLTYICSALGMSQHCQQPQKYPPPHQRSSKPIPPRGSACCVPYLRCPLSVCVLPFAPAPLLECAAALVCGGDCCRRRLFARQPHPQHPPPCPPKRPTRTRG